jgi:DNA invertase Pin-like site-specific DNA recombinase/peptidoglycan hydrolase-like protein with peptidoglycan-binding domain
MLSQLLTCSARAAVMLTVAAVVAGGPVPAATAAPPRSTVVSSEILREGLGLGARPSVRVRRVQRILARRGYDLGPPGVDGRFGPLTAAALRRLQERYGLVPDGIVGPKTRRLLTLLDAVERAQRPAERSRPPAPVRPPAARQPQKPAPQPSSGPGRSATQPRPVRPARIDVTSSQRDAATLATILAVFAALLAAAALVAALLRREHAAGPATVVPIAGELFLEGYSDQSDLGSFRGFALATTVPADARGDPRRTRFLISDPRKPAPVWVRSSDIHRSLSQLAQGERVIGYVTKDPDPIREQQAFIDIETLCEQAGWELEEIVRDDDTGPMLERPGMRRLLAAIADGDARGAVITDTHKLIGSLSDLGALLEWFRDANAALVALDLELDTTTVPGRLAASTLIAVAQRDRERAASRARSGLAPSEDPDRPSAPTAGDRGRLIERIKAMRSAGMSLQAIAGQLNREGVPPIWGRTWRPSNVKRALANAPTTSSLGDERPTIPPLDQR